jgi:hypothetical protein
MQKLLITIGQGKERHLMHYYSDQKTRVFCGYATDKRDIYVLGEYRSIESVTCKKCLHTLRTEFYKRVNKKLG